MNAEKIIESGYLYKRSTKLKVKYFLKLKIYI